MLPNHKDQRVNSSFCLKSMPSPRTILLYHLYSIYGKIKIKIQNSKVEERR